MYIKNFKNIEKEEIIEMSQISAHAHTAKGYQDRPEKHLACNYYLQNTSETLSGFLLHLSVKFPEKSWFYFSLALCEV